jgi:hypothetical protein
VKVAALLAIAFVAPVMTAGAQRAAAAAVVRPASVYARPTQAPTDSIRPLLYHMKRGAKYGGFPGLVLGALVVVAIANDSHRCCDRQTKPLSTGKRLGALALGTASGATTGALLGFMYHFELVEERQRAIARP